ncbi:AMP-binding enzyme [Lentzea terrae]|uniref:AMP-binding enzyme n=1 Tax=Lentzea terrae TaxID=2200761 RepID=UPI0013004CF6
MRPIGLTARCPKAFVVTQGDVTADELVAAKVAPIKKVRQVEFVAEIPRSVSGKVLRRLKDCWCAS